MRKLLIISAVIGLFVVGCSGDDEDGEEPAAVVDPLAECIERAEEGNLFCAEVSACSCNHCADALEECDADPECMAIIQCASEKNCNGIACYSPATCMDVINAAQGGATGIAVAIATEISNCVADNNCPDPSVCN